MTFTPTSFVSAVYTCGILSAGQEKCTKRAEMKKWTILSVEIELFEE